jgi:hypothetical protein
MGVRHVRGAIGTSTGTKTFVIDPTTGETPVAAMLILTTSTSGTGESNPHQISVGLTDGTNHRCGVFSAEHGVGTTNTWTKLVNDAPLISIDPNTGAINGVAEFDGFVANGIQLDITDAFPANSRILVVLFFPEGTGYDVAVGSLTASGSPSINLGWRPDQVITFAASEGASSGFTGVSTTAGDAGGWFGLGFLDCDGSSDVQRSLGWSDDDGEAAGSGGTRSHHIINEGTVFDDAVGENIALTTDSGGFDALGSGFLGYLAIQYNGNNQHAVKSISSPTSTGSYAITGIGFQPSYALELQSILTNYNTALDATGFAYGISSLSDDDTVKGVSLYGRTQAVVNPTSTATRVVDGIAARLVDQSGTAYHTATLTSFDSDGYTRNFTVANGTLRRWACLAVGPLPGAGGSLARRRMGLCETVEPSDPSVRSC